MPCGGLYLISVSVCGGFGADRIRMDDRTKEHSNRHTCMTVKHIMGNTQTLSPGDTIPTRSIETPIELNAKLSVVAFNGKAQISFTLNLSSAAVR